MQVSERSNGLRWYLNLFVALKANHTKSSNVIFLMDEPGVHLHVDAQKNCYHYLLIYQKMKIK